MAAFEEFQDDKTSRAQFESGTLEGLMQDMVANKGSVVGIFDEFSTFKDNLDKGSSGSAEKGRYLSLFNASTWKKTTKGSGYHAVEDPRFNLISYTQPTYACNFSRNNTADGFFQRFLITLPAEVFIDPDTKEDIIEEETDSIIDLADVFKRIYEACDENPVLKMTTDAYESYKVYAREVNAFRKKDLFEEARVSIKSKSVGIVVRLAGVLCLLREGLLENHETFDLSIKKDDIERAIKITRYSNEVSFSILSEKKVQQNINTNIKKSPVPDADNMTMEFLAQYNNKVKSIISKEFTTLADINKNNIYPIINNLRTKEVGKKFIDGLVKLGFGTVEIREGKSGFKRHHPKDDNCPNKEALQAKWQKLDIQVDE